MIKIALKDTLASKNITFRELSKNTGISRQRLSKVANNSTPMLNIQNLSIVQKYLNVPISDLIVSDEDNDHNKDIHNIYKEITKIDEKIDNMKKP